MASASMPYVPGATDGVVTVQVASPFASVTTGAGHVKSSPGGPSVGARSEHDSPLSGAPFAVATTVTVSVSPGVTDRAESVMLRVNPVAELLTVDVSLTSGGVVVAEAPPGGVPLITGPETDDPGDCMLARVCAKAPASMPVAEQASKMIAATNRERWIRKDGLEAMWQTPSLQCNQAINLANETMPALLPQYCTVLSAAAQCW